MNAPIIITADMGKTDQAWANGLRREHYPAERNVVDAHITLFHHLPPNHLPEIKSRLVALVKDYPAPAACLSDVMLLGTAVAFRVDSAELLSLREELADTFRGLLIPQDQATPKLHITVQNKVEPPVAKALHAQLLDSFRMRPLAISGLSAHYYRGGPWEHIGRWSFRG
jgi:hypothetical protein